MAVRRERLEGNLAKQRIQRRLRELITERAGLSILDVGCVGPSPLAMWRWTFEEFGGQFRLTGSDVAGVQRAERLAREYGWRDVRFVSTTRYGLDEALGDERFDVVLSTQVLEHVRDARRFMAGLARAMKPDARAFIALDSGHFRRNTRTLRGFAKWVVVRLGAERYHERGVRIEELEPAFVACGLEVVDRKFFNVHPLKWVHNHGLSGDRDCFAERWYELELMMNADPGYIERGRHLFQGLYYELVKVREVPSAAVSTT